MKKIFTLLFCVAAMSLTASATDNGLVDRCLKMLLNEDANTAMLMSPNMDINHDGVFNIADLTALIDKMIAERETNMAPENTPTEADINGMIRDAIGGVPPTPTIQDVTNAIDKKKKDK